MEGVNQVNVNVKAGLTFAAALRSFLRQDPDVILIGEIRDLETAEIAVKAAQTGHMVLATLHTNDAPQTITRLMNMGVPSYNVAAALNLIMAQRLARRLCKRVQATAGIAARRPCCAEGFTEEEIDAGLTDLRSGRLRPLHRRLQGAYRHLSGHADLGRHAQAHHARGRPTSKSLPRPSAKASPTWYRPVWTRSARASPA